MNGPGDNGRGADPPPDMDVVEQGAIMMIASFVHAFRPTLTEQDAINIATAQLKSQAGLGRVMTDALDPEKRATHGIFGFKLINLTTREVLAEIHAPKDLLEAKTLNELKHGVDVIAYATSPAARAVLHGFGFVIEFFQKKKSEPPRVVLPE